MFHVSFTMTDKQNKRCENANSEQKELLAEFMKNHPKLVSSKFSSDFSFKDAQKLWQKAGEVLNAVPGGGHKTWIQWRKTWQDLQSRTKKKGAEIKKMRGRTGGGSLDDLPKFKPEEEAVLDLISKASAEGHDVAETEITFQLDGEITPSDYNNAICETSETSTIPQLHQSAALASSSTSLPKSTIKRKSSAKLLQQTVAHADYLGGIQKDYFSFKQTYCKEMLELKRRKVEAAERQAAALEKIGKH